MGRLHITFSTDMQWFIGSVYNIAHPLLTSSGQNQNCAWGWNNTLWPFSCISKIIVQKKHVFFLLCMIFYQIYCVMFSYINSIFPQTSVFPFKWYQEYAYPCFRSWATYRQFDLGMSFYVKNVKKWLRSFIGMGNICQSKWGRYYIKVK